MGRPFDVVILNESARTAGGADRVACATAAGLARRGHRVRLLSADAGDPEAPDPDLEAAGVELRPLALLSAYERSDRKAQLRALGGNPDAPAAVLAAVEGLDPRRTLVHVHNAALKLTWTAVDALARWGARTVLTAHDYGAACPTGNFFDYPANAVCPRRPLGASCLAYECTGGGRKARLPRVLAAAAARRAGVHARYAAVLYPSPLARRVMEPYLSAARHHEVLPNPQDLVPGPPSVPSRSDIFLYVGRLMREKAPGLFLRAAESAGVRARIVGDGPLRPDLEREFPRAEFAGWLPPEAVAAEFAAARAHVFPSLWRETMGLGVLDAASRGIPTVLTDLVGAADWVRDHDAGLLVPAGDPASLADALVRLRDDALVDALGARAYGALWADPPTLERHLDRLETVYARAMGV